MKQEDVYVLGCLRCDKMVDVEARRYIVYRIAVLYSYF